MKDINIKYPVSHLGTAVTIPDKFTLRHIIGNILGLNGPVLFDDLKFSARHYTTNVNGNKEGRISITISKRLFEDEYGVIYQSNYEPLEDLEIIIYNIMKSIDKFPDRDVRYEVSILDLEEEE